MNPIGAEKLRGVDSSGRYRMPMGSRKMIEVSLVVLLLRALELFDCWWPRSVTMKLGEGADERMGREMCEGIQNNSKKNKSRR